MPNIVRTRTLRPSTRLESSSYKVDTKKVGSADMLQLTIFVEGQNKQVLGEFEFPGTILARKDSFHFSADIVEAKWRITFSGAQPTTVVLR